MRIAWSAMVVFAACMGQAAFGHAFLEKSTPQVGATVTSSPKEVRITFSEDVVPTKCEVEVVDARGVRVDQKDLHGDEKDAAVLVVSVPELGAGKYTVKWKATCVYGHKTEGSFGFSVKGS